MAEGVCNILRLLLVEDCPEDEFFILKELEKAGYQVHSKRVSTETDLRSALLAEEWDVVTSDHRMPQLDAPATMRVCQELAPDLPVVIVSGEIDLNLAVSLLKQGARDYVQKSQLLLLPPAIDGALKTTDAVHELRRTNEELRKTNQLLQSVLESPRDIVVFSIDREYRYTAFTVEHQSRMKEYWNTDIELGSSLLESITNPEMRARAKQYIDLALMGEHNVVQTTFTDSRHGVVTQEAKYSPIYSEDGSVEGVTIFASDVTQFVQSEMLSRRLQSAISGATEGIAVLNPEGKYLYVNQAHVKMYGYSADSEMLGRSWEILYDVDQRDFVANRVLPIISSNGWWVGSTPAIRADGTVIDVEVSLTRLEDGYLVCIARDLSEKIAAEQAIKNSEEKFRLLFEHLTSGFVLCEATADATSDRPDFMVVEANNAFVSLTPVHPSLLFSQPVSSLLPSPESNWLKTLYRVATTRQSDTFAVKIGQVPRYFQVQAFSPKAGQVALILNDTTEIELAMNEIRLLNQSLELRVAERTSQIESKNRELEAFSYSVSHDLRSPLRSLNAYSSLLAKDYAPNLDLEGIEYLERIRNAADRMNQIIDDLLSLSSIEKTEFERTTIDLTTTLRTLVAETAKQYERQNYHLKIEEGLTTEGDEKLVQLALQNLIENAFKFSSGRNTVEIEFSQDGDAFLLRDHGAGFDMRFVDKLFTPFQRLHSQHEFAGTGIGLAIVKRVIDRHGGWVKAESTLDVGTTITFSLGSNGKL